MDAVKIGVHDAIGIHAKEHRNVGREVGWEDLGKKDSSVLPLSWGVDAYEADPLPKQVKVQAKHASSAREAIKLDRGGEVTVRPKDDGHRLGVDRARAVEEACPWPKRARPWQSSQQVCWVGS